jgi:hypothetical protein
MYYSFNVIRVIELKMAWAGHVAHRREITNACIMLVEITRKIICEI